MKSKTAGGVGREWYDKTSEQFGSPAMHQSNTHLTSQQMSAL